MKGKSRTFLSPQDLVTASEVELLDILRNKARCEHSTETSFRVLRELSTRLLSEEYNKLFISMSHIEKEGCEEFDNIIQKLILKYEHR